ncbi:carboxylic ester hydrolase-28 [Coleophoma cylindrospora]|uniref:Carboxylic ester hydrolase n=1 Tax=Coleophoma cylindrospora TaxID=1849047 RepID=A0A3D8RSW1_9HELO|nr:carboxylic ester hydrolase-28 [Coleophoma cylindrospora]
MFSLLRPLGLLTLLASSCLVGAQNLTVVDPAAACTALGQNLALENVTVNFAEYLPAGTNLSLSQGYNLSTCGRASQVVPVDLCRITMYVATTNRSGITLEGWLPTNWTGRFLMTGNGGVSGCIQYEDVAYATSFGFATFGQNNGHNGTRGYAFYQNSDVVEDFIYRGLYTGTVVGKQITNTYYTQSLSTSFYLGCSTGGRQGWKMIQDYPEVFDGVVVGAPALYFPALTSWSGTFYTILGNSSSDTFVSADLWVAVNTEIMNQCDGIDGVMDGIIEDTLLCNFRPEAMQCAPGVNNSTTCLTSAQVGAVRQVFTDYYGLDGLLVFPKMQPGSELLARYIYYGGTDFSYTTDWFRYVVYEDPSWDPASYTRADAKAAIDQNPFNAMTGNGDLSAFQKHGGKVLHWHGEADYIITSDNSPRYYNHVSETMGLPSSELDDFYRFFRVSGTGHCQGGAGAHMVGQQAAESAATDPQNNVLARIITWVEDGNAPETITGTKYVNDDATQGVAFVRNHCKYPLRNVYTGPANYTQPEAWTCI